MGMLIAYHQGHIANMGQPPTLSGLSVLRGAPSRTARTPRYTCRPALHGGRTRGARRADTDRTRAFGRRLEAPPRAARSALGSRIFIFSSGTRGLEEQGGSTSAGFRASGGDDRGKPRPGTMPTDRVDDPQIVPWIEKDDLAYYGPFRCVSAPARPARRTTRVQIDAAPTTAVFAREGWRWRKIRFDALERPSEESARPTPGYARTRSVPPHASADTHSAKASTRTTSAASCPPRASRLPR